MLRFAPFTLLSVLMIGIAGACTCVTAAVETAEYKMKDASLVFRGTALEIKLLPQHPEMRGRRRYSITFRVDQYWKGSPAQTVTLYDLDPGTDCLGFSYQLGKEYLIYGSEEGAKDYKPDDYFWFGWTDVLAPGTPMLQPMACTPSGLASDRLMRSALRELGPGKVPRRR